MGVREPSSGYDVDVIAVRTLDSGDLAPKSSSLSHLELTPRVSALVRTFRVLTLVVPDKSILKLSNLNPALVP